METHAGSLLVVDDDPSIRLLCRVNLEFEGWTVHDAATLSEARAFLADGEIRILLLDVHIGPESGVDFLDEVRREHPAVRVAMLTGSVGRTTVDDTTPDGVIAKPFTIDELTQTVERLATG